MRRHVLFAEPDTFAEDQAQDKTCVTRSHMHDCATGEVSHRFRYKTIEVNREAVCPGIKESGITHFGSGSCYIGKEPTAEHFTSGKRCPGKIDCDLIGRGECRREWCEAR